MVPKGQVIDTSTLESEIDLLVLPLGYAALTKHSD